MQEPDTQDYTLFDSIDCVKRPEKTNPWKWKAGPWCSVLEVAVGTDCKQSRSIFQSDKSIPKLDCDGVYTSLSIY